ncbi:MAG: hypothetical protein NW205_03150 [Hyphomicrobiaceae bacterium]|nr:hypothetical protein [Hyphomicrobiaceae bacterium]
MSRLAAKSLVAEREAVAAGQAAMADRASAPSATTATSASRVAVVTPGQAGGVFDYGALMAEKIGARHVPVNGDAPDQLLAATGAFETLYLQFSGYGFHARGVPSGLARWARVARRRGQRLGIFFHELYAFGPPWTSAFWLNPAQRLIAADLVRSADFWLTNRRASAEWLLAAAGPKPFAVLPTPSNVGEGEDGVRHENREASLVVFGSAGVRERTYRNGGDDFLAWAGHNGYRVHDVGPRLSDDDLEARLTAFGVERHGALPSDAVSTLMAKARVGVVDYRIDYAAKSSVLGAYAAFGLTPVVYARRHAAADGLVAGTTYLDRLVGLPGNDTRLAEIAEAARGWYRGHDVARHAASARHLMEAAR